MREREKGMELSGWKRGEDFRGAVEGKAWLEYIVCDFFFPFIKIILAGTKWENAELWDPLSVPVTCSFNLGTEKLSSAMVQALDSRIYKELCLQWQCELEK